MVKHRPVRIRVQARGALRCHRPQLGHVEDLSEHGMYFSCSQPLPEGDEVTVLFDLPTPRRSVRIWVRAQVRHSTKKHGKSGMGLRFLRLEFDHAQLIRAFVLWMSNHPEPVPVEIAA